MLRSEFLFSAASTLLATGDTPERLHLVAAPLGRDIDPYRDTGRGVDELAWLYADGLFGWDGGPTPLLAARAPDLENAGLTYRYTLRDAVWHDGRPFTASDVAEAFRAVQSSEYVYHEPYRSVRAVTVRGTRRFDVHLHSQRHDFARSFFGAYGVPVLPFVRRGSDGRPVGTGPFAVAALPEIGRWTLRRWNRSPRGVPSIAELDVRLIDFDPTRTVQMISREAQLALPLAPDAMAPSFSWTSRFTSTVVLLLNAERAFRDVAVRRAFAGAIDVRALQTTYSRVDGGLRASLLMTGRNDARWEHALRRDSGSAAALRSLLGDRELTLAYVESPAHNRTILSLRQYLLAAGVRSQLRGSPFFRYLGANEPLRSGDFDVAIVGFPYLSRDYADLAPDWSCLSRPPRGGNFARWCDAQTERALASADTASALRRLYDEMACVPLGTTTERIGISNRLDGMREPVPLVPFTYACSDWRWRS